MTEKDVRRAAFLDELAKIAATADLVSAKVPKVSLPGGKTTPPSVQSISPLPKSPWKLKDFPSSPSSSSSSSSKSSLSDLSKSIGSFKVNTSAFNLGNTSSQSSMINSLLRSATRGTSLF